MAANACLLEPDGSPFLILGERIVHAQPGGFSMDAGSGYPGQTRSYQNDDCHLFVTNLRVVVCARHPTPQFSSFVLPLWLITDEKVVEPRFGPVRLEGWVVPIPGLGLPTRGRFALVFPDRAEADVFQRAFDPTIEEARRCQVLGGSDAAAHHSVCIGPGGDAAIDYVSLALNRALVDPNDPGTILLPSSSPAPAAPVSASDVQVSVLDPPNADITQHGAPDRRGYQRLYDGGPR